MILAHDHCRDDVFARGLARVQEYLSAARDNSMCLICLGAIKPAEAIWHCHESCHAVFHLTCIQVEALSRHCLTSHMPPGCGTPCLIC